ncbi:MAG: hypothetical protein HY320_10545, partial [Armatimonadetes bacterium]|nr:hypothetical protein [Armatimonadota bacterium]
MARDSVHRPVLRWGRGAWLALLLVACAAPAVTAPVRSRPATRPAHRPAPRTVDAASLPDRPPADPDAIWHVRDLRPGMKGYGFTVFKGDKVERFGVTIIGVLPKMYMGQDMVLIRLDGGPITGRNAFLIHGMSGSPIYVDGKLVGAFSMAASNYWAKEPIGAVTPIEAMLEALDPKLDPEPVGITSAEMTLPNPIPTSAGAMRDIFMGPESLAPPDAPGRLTLRPLATPVMVSGLGSRAFKQLASFLEHWNLLAQPAPGQAPANLKPKLEVGGSLGVNLMTGDIDISGIGTVTWMKGDRVLGWGHPFFQLGGAQFGISNAWVYDIFPGVQASNKIAAAGEVIGTLDHDRPFCVSGRVGPRPTMIPITCNVEDRSTGRKKTFRAEAVNHPQLMGQMATIAVGEAIFETRPVPGDITANVRLSIDTEGLGHIERRNMVYDQFQIDSAATLELAQMLQLLSSNDLKRVPVKALNVDVTLEKKQPTATVERIFIKQERYEPGETVDVGVVLRLYRGETTVLHTNVKIPEGAQGGRAVLMVNGGATRVNLAALTGGSTGIVPLPGATPAAATVSQLVKQFLERERNDQIVTHLLFSSSAVNINGEKLSRLPGPIADVMRSSRTTGLRVEQDEVKSASDTEFVVQGVQRLFITIQRKDSSETGTGASSEGSGAPGASPGSPGTARNLLVPDDEAVLSDARRFASPEEDETPAVAPGASPPPAGNGAAEAPKKPSEAKKKSARAEQKPGEAEKKPEPESPPVDDQLLGKAATWWTQTSFADFQRGTNQGTGATLRGEVRLAPSLKLLYESGEQFIWSVVALRGEYYTGTGNSGLVLCVGRDGKSSEFFRTGELEVHALAKDGAGNLYAGTSPHGRVYRIDPSGKGTLLMELSRACSETNPNGPTEPARYVLCLAVAA